jgi:hypothetical protein
MGAARLAADQRGGAAALVVQAALLPFLAVRGEGFPWGWALGCALLAPAVAGVAAAWGEASPRGALAAQGTLAAFAVAVSGARALLVRLGLPPHGARLLAAALGLALVATPYYANFLVEAPGGPLVRDRVLVVLLGANPLMAAFGPDGLALDWLRTEGLYGRFVVGGYYPFRYPGAGEMALRLGVTGLVAGLLAVRRSGR